MVELNSNFSYCDNYNYTLNFSTVKIGPSKAQTFLSMCLTAKLTTVKENYAYK